VARGALLVEVGDQLLDVDAGGGLADGALGRHAG
jgi:hypothetical protein